MSVHLVGGGRDLGLAEVVYGGFVTEAVTRAGGRPTPRIGVVVVADAAGLAAGVDWFGQALGRCGPVEVAPAVAIEESDSPLRLADGSAPEESWFAGLDGLLVGGGLTPAYHRVLQPYAPVIRRAVRGGLPYAGFSAGAVLAASRALLGGWRLGEVAVTHEDNAEEFDQLTVVDGLALVDLTVDVHAAQWGTLSRLVAALADAGARTGGRGIAIDENTVVILGGTSDSSGPPEIRGAGQAWLVETADGGVRVNRRPAG